MTTHEEALAVFRGEQEPPPVNNPGMTWDQALDEAVRTGVSRCSDPAAMAQFLDSCTGILIGPGVSPQMLWAGAQRMGLSNLELARMIHADRSAAADLMFYQL